MKNNIKTELFYLKFKDTNKIIPIYGVESFNLGHYCAKAVFLIYDNNNKEWSWIWEDEFEPIQGAIQ